MKRTCKEIDCENTVKGRFLFCKDCIKKRHRSNAKAHYHDNKKPWEPYKKLCKNCQGEFTVEDPDKANTVYCRTCAPLKKKSWYKEYKRNQSAVHRKTGFNSVEIVTRCKCPTCDYEYSRPLFLTPEARARVDAGRPFPKRCFNCKGNLGWDGYCNIADAHLGVNI